MHPELIVIGINVLFVAIAYLIVYPVSAGSDVMKLAQGDLLTSALSLLAAGVLFWGTPYRFNLLFFETNWFWFALSTYLIIETPFALWYLKKYDVRF